VTANDRSAANTASRRWLARIAFLLVLAALIVLVIGGLKSVAVFLVGIICFAVALAAGWWFLSTRGAVRWVAAVIAIAAPITAIWVYIDRGVLLPILAVVVLLVVAGIAARAALATGGGAASAIERETPPPRRPFIIMNPRSGGGKVTKFDLQRKAEALGADVALLDGPGTVDVAALAREAVANGADMLGVAGGDGTQALVAGIASEHGLPFLVISAGTRNHFAMDLGLDRERPQLGLDALTDGVELTLDLGVIGGRTFVNNASFGAYAEIVQSPAYRDDKRGTTLKMLPDLLTGQRGPRLTAFVDGMEIAGAQAILISNNPYELADLAGLGHRASIDRGVLGVVVISVDSAAQAAALLSPSGSRGLRSATAREVIIDADTAEIPVGIDGESVILPTPVRCEIRPGALRVRVPRHRLGPPKPKPSEHLDTLRRLALS
jgi:diacylglycerol kinase family enzyme